MTTLHQYDPPLQSPNFIDSQSSCSNEWSNSTMIDSPVESPKQDYMLSQESNKENDVHYSQEESMCEENIFIEIEETPTSNPGTVQLASKGED